MPHITKWSVPTWHILYFKYSCAFALFPPATNKFIFEDIRNTCSSVGRFKLKADMILRLNLSFFIYNLETSNIPTSLFCNLSWKKRKRTWRCSWALLRCSLFLRTELHRGKAQRQLSQIHCCHTSCLWMSLLHFVITNIKGDILSPAAEDPSAAASSTLWSSFSGAGHAQRLPAA